MNYLAFLLTNRRFLGFAVLMTGCSAFGQTFYISLFGGEIRADFGLSSGEFGSYYAVATLASGFSLIWLGGLVDRFALRGFAVAVIVALALACLSLAFASNGMVLIVAFYALRLAGQGFMTHTAMTAAGRYFDANRGKAISITGSGFPLGQAVFPMVAVALSAVVGWRQTWMIGAAVLVIGLVPLVWWLLKGHHERHADHAREQTRLAPTAPPGHGGKVWTRNAVLRDPRFYILVPMSLAAPFVLTGLFFHQVHLASEKGWTLEWMAVGLVCFSVVQFVGSLIAGGLVDRFSARALYGWSAVPMILGLLVLASGDHPMIAIGYLMLGGLTAGLNGTIGSALWPELYGTRHLGAIRSLSIAIMVFGTAASPAVYGWLIDANVTMEQIAIASAIYTALAVAFVQTAKRLGAL